MISLNDIIVTSFRALFNGQNDRHTLFAFVLVYYCGRYISIVCRRVFILRLITWYLVDSVIRSESYPNRFSTNGEIDLLIAQVDLGVQLLHFWDSHQQVDRNVIKNNNVQLCIQLDKCNQNILRNSVPGCHDSIGYRASFLDGQKWVSSTFLPGSWI